MRIRIITIHAVHQGDDDRSFGHPAWWFYSKHEAEEVAKGRGWFGGNAPVRDYQALSLEDDRQAGRINGWSFTPEPPTVYLLANLKPLRMGVGPADVAALKAAALAKLTDTEKELLGLK
jgi:hypothetical protein